MDWNRLADDAAIERTAKSLKANGIETIVVLDRNEARKKVLELIPAGSEVLCNSSVTLDETGISKEIEESGRYVSVRKRISAISDKEKRNEMRRMCGAAQYAIGSVHAVTVDGQVMFASQSGSQLSPYAFSAANVIWVVGTQKIVKDVEEGFRRLREHCLVLENERAKKAYGAGSSINKILIIEKEIVPNRIKLIFVKEKLGF